MRRPLSQPLREGGRFFQQKSNWCWAAGALMSASTVVVTTVTQSDIVQSVKGNTDNNTASVSEICSAASFASNHELTYSAQGVLSEFKIINELSEGNPVLITRGWYLSDGTRNGGHVTIIYGYYQGEFFIRDPWPVSSGDSYTRTYAEIVNGRSSGVDTGKLENCIIIN